MTPERWRQVEKVFQSALERDPAERSAFLDSACGGDTELRREVESLLAADQEASSFIDPSAPASAAKASEETQIGAMLGRVVGHYKILSLLGAGGMGEVYLAEDTQLGRRVALKVLIEGLAADVEHKRRFVQEARAASALNHPHILTIYEIGSDAGRGFIAMEYVEGQSLRQRLKVGGPLRTKEILNVGTQLASAIARAHEAGIIHRDLKPENIMLRPDGYTKILDFGLAKLAEGKTRRLGSEDETAVLSKTTPGIVLGTPRYMSPEQARGEHVDHRSDIFSLGCVLYEMATAHAPFAGDGVVDTVHAIIHDEPRPIHELNADVPPELERIVSKCLEKDPADRYQHADEIGVDLRHLLHAVESGRHEAFLQGGPKKRIPVALGLYFLAAWATIQLVHWLVNRYVLSPYLVDVAFVSLLLLIPSVVLVAYFRLLPGRKRRSSVGAIGVPVNVVAAIVVLFVIFHGKDLGAATKAVTVQNEEGEKLQRVVPKNEFRKKLVIFFFDNDSGDPTLDWLQYSLTLLLDYDLLQDPFMEVETGYDQGCASNFYVYEKMKKAGFVNGLGLPLTLKKSIATQLHTGYFVSGSVSRQNEGLSIRVSLHDGKSGKLLVENTFAGDDVFRLVDQISVGLKRSLQIPERHIQEVNDLAVAEILTRSVPALKLYTAGQNALVFDQDWKKAQGQFEQAVKEDPTFAFGYLQLEILYTLAGQADKREEAFQMLMQHLYKLPERIQFFAKAGYYEFKQDPDKQFAVAKMFVDLYPQDLLAHYFLGFLYELRNQPDQAISEYKLILELDPEQYTVLQAIGVLYRNKGMFDEALRYYKQYADQFPDDARSFTFMGGLYKALGDYQQARSYYDKASLIEPQDVSIMLGGAKVEFDAGNFEPAFRQCREALKVCKTPQDRMSVYGSLSSFCEAKGQIEKSLEYLNLMLAEGEKFQPVAIRLLSKLGSLDKYVEAGRTDEAVKVIKNIETGLGRPWDQFVPLGYLNIYLESENPEEADRAVEGVEALIRTFAFEMLRSRVFYARGRIQEMRGQCEQAIASYQKNLELAPTDAIVNMYIGRCYRKLNQLQTAQESVQRTLKVYPFNPKAHCEAALCYWELGDRETALQHLKTALDVWKDADPEYKPAKKAREKLAEFQPS